MPERSYRGLLWSLVLVGLTLDLVTKYAVFLWLYNHGTGDTYAVVPGLFELTAQYTGQVDEGDHPLAPLRTWGGEVMPRVNQGALFGLANSKGAIANTVFALVSIAAALAIVYWSMLASTVSDRSLCAALGLILGGTLGNLYDRIVFGGVRDFVHWHYYDQYEWPVFNIADCCLVCGAFLLLVQAFWARPVPAEMPSQSLAQADLAQAK